VNLLSARDPAKGQFFTPAWAAELLLRRAFPHLAPGDVVMDPTCGDARFLMAVPAPIDAFGVEIDPGVAEEARRNSGRPVITGDFLHAALPLRPTHIIGNPPFVADLIDDILARCYEELEYDRTAAFLLPVYFFQTASTVVRLSRRWSITQEMVPRNLFERLQRHLVFAQFTKARQCVVSGFFLYSEVDALDSLREEFRAMFIGNKNRPGAWRETVYIALRICGGRATLKQLYQCIENKRPTDNPFWREKIRQIARQHFMPVGEGEYALPVAA
jgi:adenine-specific DNA-methyltransferase